MSEAQLNILNYALLALLYLFFGRVLWAVWAEVRGPRAATARAAGTAGAGAALDPTVPTASNASNDPTAVAGRGKAPKPPKASKGVPSKLVVLEPKVRKGSAFAIGHEVLLGRADSCTIGLNDDTFASTLHARVYAADGGVLVEDLGSTNGTHVNGARIARPTPLLPGDRLQVGSTIFEAR